MGYWGYQSGFSGMDYLRKLAASIGRSHNVKVESTYTSVTHANVETRTVYIREDDAWMRGDDYVVGNLLHEIGHIHLTPWRDKMFNDSQFPKSEAELHNMLEDERINEIIADTYEGGAYYLDAFIGDAVEDIQREAKRPAFVSGVSDEIAKATYMKREGATPMVDPMEEATEEYEHLEAMGARQYQLDAAIQKLEMLQKLMSDPQTEEQKEQTKNKQIEHAYKKQVYFTIITSAIAKLHGSKHEDVKLEPVEWEKASDEVVELLKRARYETAENIFPMAKETIKVLKPWVVDDSNSSANTSALIKQLKMRGHRVGPNRNDTHEKERYSKADATARSNVDKLRRKLIARLRENDHQRFHGGKKKGKLDKKALSRVARGNYRLFRKREEKKGIKYTVSVILDTSGSMFGISKEQYSKGIRGHTGDPLVIDIAMQASALLVRTFRSIGFRTSLTLFGSETQQILAHGDMYTLPNVEKAIQSTIDRGRDIYDSGDNRTAPAFANEIKRLKKAGAGTHKLCIMVTDGGLEPHDILGSRKILHAEMRAGGFTPIIFYIGHNEQILKDPRYERHIEDIDTLIPAAVELARSAITGL